MEPGQGEFGLFFLDTVLPGDGVHAHATFDHQLLTHLDTVLQILGQGAPAHHLELSRGIIGPEPVKTDQHFGHGRLVVLGVTHLRQFHHVNLEQTVIHSPSTIQWIPS